MLELRPTCENCNTKLPPESPEARICTFECTFCRRCAEEVLSDVCPNCGGNFCPRPIRPRTDWKAGDFLGRCPASTVVKHRPVDLQAHAKFSEAITKLRPEER